MVDEEDLKIPSVEKDGKVEVRKQQVVPEERDVGIRTDSCSTALFLLRVYSYLVFISSIQYNKSSQLWLHSIEHWCILIWGNSPCP
jgi:hypothetical protein